MKKKFAIVIPALSGGQRLKNKNLILVDGEPLCSYVIRAAKKVVDGDKIFLNTDIMELASVAKFHNIEFYERSPNRGGSLCTMHNNSSKCNKQRCQVHDHFLYDFMKNVESDYVVQIHTTSPLLTPETIQKFINFCDQNEYDSVFTILKTNKETFYNSKPINFSLKEKTPTQNLIPLEEICWAITAWKREEFLLSYEKQESPTFLGNMGFFILDNKIEAIDVDSLEDLYIAEACLSHKKRLKNLAKHYYNSNISTIERDLKDLINKDGCSMSQKLTHNKRKNNIVEALETMGEGSWCYPVIMTDNDQACFIQQVPGEGCRWHSHPTKDEFWIVMKGEFLFEFEGEQPIIAKKGDVIFAEKALNHRITCISDTPAIRFACGETYMSHIYPKTEPKKLNYKKTKDDFKLKK